MSRDDLHFRLRIPEDLKTMIASEADSAGRSMTAEIVERLRRSFVDPRLPDDLVKRIDYAAQDKQRSFEQEILSTLDRAYPPDNISVSFVRDYLKEKSLLDGGLETSPHANALKILDDAVSELQFRVAPKNPSQTDLLTVLDDGSEHS
ncbi:Arc family DNA-binding protein [Aureimonas sp. OT7]|uniref:Arc family DNA-binding protein n=1 Tax=Aureimonas sp. OT7 TaxID=2816454 RepID=UPI00177B37E4|nr:Arc family DNA-binding protein [Aureimonas sp. OT7]QOG06551.1 Arc family DNA-binding protein [Aureimonas sp. OT7]